MSRDRASGSLETTVQGATVDRTLIGLILTTSAVAFEGLAISTVAPSIAEALRGLHYYAWIFSSYTLAQLIGASGLEGRGGRQGLVKHLLAALAMFEIGLGLAATSRSMPMLLLGRSVQGIGAGGLINGVYSVVASRYPDHVRPKILAVLSTCYVIPATIGPSAAALLTSAFGWPSVFWALIPLPLIGTLLLIGKGAALSAQPAATNRRMAATGRALVVAGGSAAALWAMAYPPRWLPLLLFTIALVTVTFSARSLLSSSVLHLSGSMPAALSARGLVTAGYFTAESFLVFALTHVRHVPLGSVGLVVTTGALSWTAGAWVQARLDTRSRWPVRRIAGTGTTIMLGGIMLMTATLVTPTASLVPIAVLAHLVTGMGMGLAQPAIGNYIFGLATSETKNSVSTSVQTVELLFPALSTGIAGGLITYGNSWHLPPPATAALPFTIPFSCLLLTAWSTRRLIPLKTESGAGPSPS